MQLNDLLLERKRKQRRMVMFDNGAKMMIQCLFCGEYQDTVDDIRIHYKQCEERINADKLKDLLDTKITEKEYLSDEPTN